MNIIEKSDAMLDINVKDVSLVLEGGTFRTVFTMGILDAFLDAGIMMPHISGCLQVLPMPVRTFLSRKEEIFRF